MSAAGGADGPLAQDRNAELVKTTVDLLQRLKTRVKVADGSVPPATVRQQATKLLGKVAEGRDPSAERQAARQEARAEGAAVTLRGFLDDHLFNIARVVD